MTRALCTAALAALVLLAACARPVIDPGPDPAKVVLKVNRTIPAQTLWTALEQQGPFPSRAVRLDNFLGPFWDIRAEVKQPDGAWWRLPLAPGQKDLLDGNTIDIKRVFLAPPGRHELRLSLAAYVNRSWEEQMGDPYIFRKGPDGQVIQEYNPRWRTQYRELYLLDLKSFATVELQAGREVVIEAFKP